MKIYDCFTFFNELDMLDIRLNTLSNKVDYFVLVEATKTHSGQPKELYFEKNKQRFDKFLNKIIHIVVDDMPIVQDGNRWTLENFQRNAIMRGLSKCDKDDIIIISDLDEIPSIEAIEKSKQQINMTDSKNDVLYKIYMYARNNVAKIKNKNIFIKYIKILINMIPIKSECFISCRQKLYYYFLNGYIKDNWIGSKIVLYDKLIKNFNASPQQIRNSLSKLSIENGGWHFSYLLTPEEISKKIKSFAHSEYDTEEYTNVSLIQKRINAGENIFGRTNEKITYLKIDNSYPKYILGNLPKYDLYINKNYKNR